MAAAAEVEALRRRRWAVWALLLLLRLLVHPAALVLANTEGACVVRPSRFACLPCLAFLPPELLRLLDAAGFKAPALPACFHWTSLVRIGPSAVSGVCLWVPFLALVGGYEPFLRWGEQIRISSAADSGVRQLAEPNKSVSKLVVSNLLSEVKTRVSVFNWIPIPSTEFI